MSDTHYDALLKTQFGNDIKTILLSTTLAKSGQPVSILNDKSAIKKFITDMKLEMRKLGISLVDYRIYEAEDEKVKAQKEFETQNYDFSNIKNNKNE